MFRTPCARLLVVGLQGVGQVECCSQLLPPAVMFQEVSILPSIDRVATMDSVYCRYEPLQASTFWPLLFAYDYISAPDSGHYRAAEQQYPFSLVFLSLRHPHDAPHDAPQHGQQAGSRHIFLGFPLTGLRAPKFQGIIYTTASSAPSTLEAHGPNASRRLQEGGRASKYWIT